MRIEKKHAPLKIILCFFIVSMFPAPLFAGKPAFKVEGTVSGLGKNANQLAAVINGEIYSTGDKIGDYEVETVTQEKITVKDLRSGEGFDLLVGEAPKTDSPAVDKPPEPKSWFEAFLEKYFPALAGFQEKAFYATIVKDLKKIHFQAMTYVLESGVPDVSIPQLVALGKLPAFMSKPRKDGYHFRIMGAKSGVRIYAEPLSGSADKKYFLVDEHGYLYAEDGRRATPESPRFETGYSVQVQ